MSKESKRSKRLIRLIISIIIVSQLLITPNINQQVAHAELVSWTGYLPIIQKSPAPSVFGAETTNLSSNKVVSMANIANLYWMRSFVFDWNQIEALQGVYDWSSVNTTGLISAYQNNLTVIATVKFTPDWAQKEPGFICGAIKLDALDEFAAFLQEVVRRYSQSPYNLKYIQLGNEPDIDPEIVPFPDNIFGCWGDDDDPYYGGGYYAEMLKVVYPAIKEIDPRVQVLIGGLLLAQDPTWPASPDPLPGRFFEGIIQNHGANYFDIVAFHVYPHWAQSVGLSMEENHPYWAHRGGYVIGKIDYLREVMQDYGTKYGYTIDKPIIQTESALICLNDTYCTDPDYPDRLGNFYQAQAEYAVIVYTRNIVQDILGTMWYTIEYPGWRLSSLLEQNGNPKPVYYALANLENELSGTWFSRQVTIPPYDPRLLQAYEFISYKKAIWVVWVSDMCQEDIIDPISLYQDCEIDPEVEPPLIDLPENWLSVRDLYGNPIVPFNNQVTLNSISPIYIELAR